ncbi:hypothetical protein K501DRAFT_192330 [Backusella circina FSU 941]|nr:hypothetical protein K501DRAFT_192330 [Backusella circina FSU 941]
MNRFNHYSPQQLQQQQFQIQQQQQQQLFYNPYLQDQQQQQQQPQYYQPPVPVQPPAQLQQFNGEAETELDEFILDLLTKPQQRLFLLKTELEFEAFIKDERQLRLDFPPMNSYQRLMIHKLAPYYQLNHYHDPLRKGVYVCKTFTTEM